MKQQTFDLVITDLEMRHVNGVLLLKRMNRENINIPMIFISESAIIAKLVKAGSGNDAVIVRPFSAALLRSTVARTLASAVPSSSPATRRGSRAISAVTHLIVSPSARRRH
jgi:DNA-binding NtrC family response regulator